MEKEAKTETEAKKDETKKVEGGCRRKVERRGGRVARVWFARPTWFSELEPVVSSGLNSALLSFSHGDYETFLAEFQRYWVESDNNRRAIIICKWIPNLYLRYVGLASVTLAFDLYELALQLEHFNPSSPSPSPCPSMSAAATLTSAAATLSSSASKPASRVGISKSLLVSAARLGNVLARLICAHMRVREQMSSNVQGSTILPFLRLPDDEHQTLTISLAHPQRIVPSPHFEAPLAPPPPPPPPKFEILPLSPLWLTPQQEEIKEDGTGENVREGGEATMRHTEWTRLFVGSSLLRESGVTRETLFQLAIWLEKARTGSGIDAGVFLHCLDVMTSFHVNSKTSSALNNLVDPDGRYAKTIRLFIRTIRSFLLQDIGHRLYATFYWLTITRCIDSSAKRPSHHNLGMMLQLSDLDATAPATTALSQTIALQLTSSNSDPSQQPIGEKKIVEKKMEEKKMVVLVGGGCGLPDAVESLRLVRGMDWTHAIARDWALSMQLRFARWGAKGGGGGGGGSGSSGGGGGDLGRGCSSRSSTMDSEQLALAEHLNSLDRLAMAEFTRTFSDLDKLEEIDEGIIAPLPQISWGETYKGSVDIEGFVWVGPFVMQSNMHKMMTGRALFRARKMAEWRINSLKVTVVRKRDSAKDHLLYYLRYERLPVTAAQITRLRVAMNITRANNIELSHLDIVNVGRIAVAQFTRLPENALANASNGYTQLLSLQFARAFLGISETNFRKDTIATHAYATSATPNTMMNVLPTACFNQRTAQSYRASFTALHRIAREKQKRRLRASGNNNNNNSNTDLDSADAAGVSRWLISMFGMRTASMIVERAHKKRPPATDKEGDEQKEDLTNHAAKVKGAFSLLEAKEVTIADTTAILFGKPSDARTGIAALIRNDVHNSRFLLDMRARLTPFFNALKIEKELPHLRTILQTIHKNMPLTLTADLACAFHLDQVAT